MLVLIYSLLTRGIGGIGRRVRLRAVWLTPWWFKSTMPHQQRKTRSDDLVFSYM